MIAQTIKRSPEDVFDLAFKYYSILSVVNNLGLVKRDCQLLAYAVSENKPVSEVKKEFVEKFSSSMATVGNIISKLYKLNVLEKNKRVVTIHTGLVLDFASDLAMVLVFTHKENGDKG